MSKMYSRMPKTMMAYLSTQKGMYFNHKYGVDKDAFIENEKLRSFYEILTFS